MIRLNLNLIFLLEVSVQFCTYLFLCALFWCPSASSPSPEDQEQSHKAMSSWLEICMSEPGQREQSHHQSIMLTTSWRNSQHFKKNFLLSEGQWVSNNSWELICLGHWWSEYFPSSEISSHLKQPQSGVYLGHKTSNVNMVESWKKTNRDNSFVPFLLFV